MRTIVVAACLAVSALLPLAASAQDAWKVEAGMYAYLPTLSGSTRFPMGQGGSEASVDVDKILDKLNMTFMGAAQARRGGLVLFTDVIYLNLGDAKSDSRDLVLGGVSLPAGASANVDLDLKGWLWTLGAGYSVVNTPHTQVDVIGGVRMLDIDQSLRWALSGNLGSLVAADRAGSRGASLQNWDVILGVKGRVALDEQSNWYAPYYFDLGFGESDLTVQAMLGVGYSFGWGSLFGAWRYIDYQMKSDQAIQTLSFNGPMIGASVRW